MSKLTVQFAEAAVRHHYVRELLMTLAFVLLSQLIAAGPIVAADKIQLGINYNWFTLDANELKNCTARSAHILFGGGIIDQYGNATVREKVREQLNQMHRAGFGAIRILIPATYQQSGDHKEGLIRTNNGDISPQDQENIKNFVSDIVSSGFGNLEVAYGFLLEGNPYCKRNNWGDCFNPSRTEDNWRFIAAATRLVNTAAKSIPRRFDLNNEACPSRQMLQATVTNAQRYLTTLASRFQQSFGNDWLISCPDSPNADRAKTLLDILSVSGLTPKYIEIHSYKSDPIYLQRILAAASDLAVKINASLIVGELSYHNDVQAKTIASFMRARPNNAIVQINQWPLTHPDSRCAIDTAPPYNPGLYKSLPVK